MNNSPLVSILMNCFNGEKYLREAIDSVLNQTYQNWELVFWDNHSTDKSKDIFFSYKDARLKYYYSDEHTTLYKARLEAEKRTFGEVIAFLDTDDWWYPEKLEKQIPLFSDSEVGFVYSNCYLYYNNSEKYKLFRKSTLPSGNVLGQLAKEYTVLMPTLCVRRDSFLSSGGFDPSYHVIGDYDLVMRLSNNYRAGVVQEPLSAYRIHDSNETHQRKQLQLQELLHLIKHMAESGNFSNSIVRSVEQRFYYIKASFLAEERRASFIKYLPKLKNYLSRVKVIAKFFKLV